MSRSSEPPGLSGSIAEVLLAIARSRTVEAVIDRAAGGIAAHPEVAQCRVWLARPGDICRTCPMREQCPDRSRCLHLVANEGDLDAGDTKRQVGAFRRFPIGVGLLGRVARSAIGDRVADVLRDPNWSRAAGWARASGIRGFVVEPMPYEEVGVGVIGAFTRVIATEDSFAWIRSVAAHAAVGVGLALSIERSEKRQMRLERENAALRRQNEKIHPHDAVLVRASRHGREPQVLSESQMRRRERENLLNALRLTRWRIYGPDGAATLLGLRPTTLASRMNKMNLRPDLPDTPPARMLPE